ncbi:MAG: hypothetical protein PWP46_1654 [Fusobacteriaceae bacterium]|jgi:hypothetical protein|nr:hypothetical protein [Fusobacteriales bacterium]MDN5304768.1 hypothetical protein [Fusobacteriaceae bacterium]
MSNNVLGLCPVCSNKLKVTKLKCSNCNTEIGGDFHLSRFEYLTKEQLYFIEVFIKNRGNIKEIEKELSISYPTVRKLLDEVIVSLGYEINEPKNKVDKKEVLEKLNNGEITAEEAVKLLK